MFVREWDDVAVEMYETAKAHGFQPDDLLVTHPVIKLALIMTEIAEGIEAVRNENPPSEKIPLFTNLEEELADAVIRIMCLEVQMNLNVAGAVLAKAEYNKSRPYMHGKTV